MPVIHYIDPETDQTSLYDIPAEELSKYKLDASELTDEELAEKFPGKSLDDLTDDDVDMSIPITPEEPENAGGGEVEGYGGVICRTRLIIVRLGSRIAWRARRVCVAY